eukprot:3692007-Amphidinium_carterae.1
MADCMNHIRAVIAINMRCSPQDAATMTYIQSPSHKVRFSGSLSLVIMFPLGLVFVPYPRRHPVEHQ